MRVMTFYFCDPCIEKAYESKTNPTFENVIRDLWDYPEYSACSLCMKRDPATNPLAFTVNRVAEIPRKTQPHTVIDDAHPAPRLHPVVALYGVGPLG